MKKFILTPTNVRSNSELDREIANLPRVKDAVGKLIDNFDYAEKTRHYINEDEAEYWPDEYVYRHVDGRVFINYWKEVRNRDGEGMVRLLRWGVAHHVKTRKEFYDETFDEASKHYMPSLVEAQCRRLNIQYDDQRDTKEYEDRVSFLAEAME